MVLETTLCNVKGNTSSEGRRRTATGIETMGTPELTWKHMPRRTASAAEETGKGEPRRARAGS